jgi:hypothetical protein
VHDLNIVDGKNTNRHEEAHTHKKEKEKKEATQHGTTQHSAG